MLYVILSCVVMCFVMLCCHVFFVMCFVVMLCCHVFCYHVFRCHVFCCHVLSCVTLFLLVLFCYLGLSPALNFVLRCLVFCCESELMCRLVLSCVHSSHAVLHIHVYVFHVCMYACMNSGTSYGASTTSHKALLC